MGTQGKQHFTFDAKEDLKLGSTCSDVSSLQAMLSAFGYLRGTYTPGEVCSCTQRSIRRYQRFYGLKPDGIVGPITRAKLEHPRCGVTDLGINKSGENTSSAYVVRGCKYNKHELTYAFLNGTSDLQGNREREIVRQAFDAWANVADLNFTEVTPGQHPDFRLAWDSGDHGDGNSFDGPGNTLAHAFFPPPCGGQHAGALHFDEAETWVDDPSSNGFVLLQVAIHEIGHLLGLSHSRDETSIMYAYYGADRIHLAQDDIDGIQALYGVKSTTEHLALTSETNSSLSRTGDEAIFEFEVPSSLAISIDGPSDADYDLYVKKGSPPTISDYDHRAYTVSSDEVINISAEQGEKYFVMVQSYDGAGDFKLAVKPSAT